MTTAEVSATTSSSAQSRISSPAPDEIGRAFHRQLLFIYLVAATVATALGALFFLSGLDFSPEQRKLVLGLVAPLSSLPQILADIWLINHHVKPLREFFRALPAPEARALAKNALSRVMDLPRLTAFRVLFIHAPVIAVMLTATSLFANRYLGLGLARWQFFMVYLVVGMFASGHAIYEYLAVKRAVRGVLPHILAHVDESERDAIASIRRLGMRAQLLFVFAFAACVPLVALGATALLKLGRLLEQAAVPAATNIESPLAAWVFLLVVGGSTGALFLSTMLSRDIVSSAGELVRAMRQVERGEVGAQLVISSTDEFADAYRGFNRMTKGLVERERLRDAFGRYVAPELADQVMKHGVSMGGTLVRATVIFIDIRGFTSLSEQMEPALVVSLLNRYFAAVSPPIREHGGFINKFGGDSLLAVFGAPVPTEDHEVRAVRAAMGVRAALGAFNAREAAAGRMMLRVGIGIHAGEMIAGSVGSPDRMEYTVIGDVVNVAARLQALTKDLGVDVLLSRAVFEKVEEFVPARALVPTSVRGRSDPLEVYALE
jgi:adenylate cyclase